MSSTLIHDLFGEVAERFPSRPAILWRSQTVTYGEIEGAANKLANYLLQKEIPEGSVVAVYSEDTVDIIISILGTLQAGCAFLPLDPYLPPQRLRLMIEEVQPQWFLVASRFARRLIDDILPPDSSIKALCLDSNQTFASEARCEFLTGYTEFAETERPNLVRDPDSLCSIYFTSGSSGRPKAIAGRLRGIDHFARWEVEMLGLDEHSRCSQLTSPAFDGFLRDVCPPLVAGATICVPDSREMILDVARLVRWIDEQSLTVLQCVPSLFRALLNQELSPDQFSALRHVVLVGEPLLPDDVGRFKQVFGDRVQLVNLYGPTETTLIKLFYPVQPGDEERRSIPIGKPLPGCRAVVVDDENKVVAPGTVGEILLRTPYRSLGYYQRPELTAKVFIQNPFSDNPQDIVYRTGDYGRQLPDGTFDFVGRRDLQVKIRGVRVELSEVENALRSHPQVRDLAVGRREDSDGSSYLCAYLVLGAAVDQDELYSHCSERLPESMVPSAFVELDALPRTPNGKVDRARLQTLRGRQVLQTKTFVEPKGPVEELLAEIWCELLGQERMSREANFFESGGHSLRGVQLMARIRSQLGVEMPLRVLFERPVLAALAEVLAERLVGEVHSDLPPLKRAAHNKGPLPLSFSQQRLWFLDQMNPGGSEYNIASAVRLLGPLQPNVLRHTLDEICRRHEVLRTVFTSFEGSPVQVVERPHGAAQVEVDLTALPEAHCQTESQRLVQQERDRPFDLERGPMLRIVLLQVGTEEFIALLVLHHIAGDGWSMGVLMREIAHLYGAFVAGRPSPSCRFSMPTIVAGSATGFKGRNWNASWPTGVGSSPGATVLLNWSPTGRDRRCGPTSGATTASAGRRN